MVNAFVFGKFLPFHKGHQALIEFALTKCRHLHVIVCVSNKETITGHIRKEWIEKTFEGRPDIKVIVFHYKEEELINSSVFSKEVSSAWAAAFRQLVPNCTLLVTSEGYGNYTAACMGIRHILFDRCRKNVPVSASGIRTDLFTNWEFLPDSVRSYFSIKVAILGTECTGKTALAKSLAAHYNCTYVSEAGRDIIADSNSFSFENLIEVTEEHARRLAAAVKGESPLVVLDTDIHTTVSYAAFVFQKQLDISNTIRQLNHAKLYLYFNNDVAFVQDGTRFNEAKRNALDISHRTVLSAHNIHLVEIAGNWQQRFDKSVAAIDQLIKR